MPPKSNNINIDYLLHELGDFGKFQVLQYVVLNFMLIPCAHILLEVVFIAYRPGYKCETLTTSQLWQYNASDIDYQQCSIDLHWNQTNSSLVSTKIIPCLNGINFSGPVDESIVPEWNLVCSKDGLSELTQTLFTAGQLIGALIFPSLADKFGRKPVHVGCGFGLFLVATGCAISPNFAVFSLLRTLSGAFQQGMVIPGFTLSMEVFPANKRTLVACLSSIWWGVCVTLLAPLAFALRNFSWRVLMAVVGCQAVFSVFEFWYIHESIRWLFANNRIDAGKEVLYHAAKVNKVNFTSIWVKCLELLDQKGTEDPENKEILVEEVEIPPTKERRQNSVQIEIELLKDSQLIETEGKIAIFSLMANAYTRKISFIIQYSWLVISLSYFGLYLTSASLSSDRYTNYFLTALMEIPGTFVLLKTFSVYGRKKSIIGMMIIAAGSLIIVSIIKSVASGSTADVSSTVFSLIGMIGVSGAFSGIWLYTPEIFPTNLRTAAMGLASATARIGSMFSSYTRILAIYAPWAPGLIFGGGCLVACSLFFVLPETHNKQLPQTIRQMELRMREKKELKKQKKLDNSKNSDKKSLKRIIYKKNPLAQAMGQNNTEEN